MPDETNIPPALTPDEWAEVEAGTFDAYDLQVRAERPHAEMALANAALPDDDPRKITRDDTVLLRTLGTFLRNGMLDRYPDPDLEARARTLLAKLAAILPPEP